jgi:hypothetical protein
VPLDLLDRSVAAGATIVGIGPYTNLALLKTARPGSLGRVPVVIGGWTRAPSLPEMTADLFTTAAALLEMRAEKHGASS